MNAYATVRSLWDAVENGCVDAVKEILAAGDVDVDAEAPNLKYQTALHHAIEKGYPEICKLLIHEGKADVNKADTFGKTPLHTAVMVRSPERCLLLIHEGKADVNIAGIFGKTPLQLAITNDSHDLCLLLIHEGNVDVNKAGMQGKTALHYAIERRSAEMCKMLIYEGKVDVDKAAAAGQTSLHFAVKKCYPEICQLLINEGKVDVNKADEFGRTPLHFAVIYNSPDVCMVLIHEGNVDVNKADEKGKTALHYAIELGYSGICKILIHDGKADVNKATKNDQTPLHTAIQTGNQEIWTILIHEANANVNDRDLSGKTFLQLAVRNGSAELCKFLIDECNADANREDGEGQTSLHHAVERGSPEICKLLIQDGKADVDKTDMEGQTSLHHAVKGGDLDICRLLIHDGKADVNITDTEGQTSLHHAVKRGDPEICWLLIHDGEVDISTRDVNGKTALCYAAENDSPEVCKILIHDGKADVNEPTNFGQTCLHFAVLRGPLDVCRMLVLEENGDVNKTNENGQTSLHHSIKRGNLEICRFLILEGKADVNRTDINGQTALHYAIDQHSPELCRILIHEGKVDVNRATKHSQAPLVMAIVKGSLELCKLLVDEGKAHVDKPDQDGNTALHHAIQRSNIDMCKLLIHEGKGDVNKANVEGRTALHQAIAIGLPEICKLLIHEGEADVNKADIHLQTPLIFTIQRESPDLCELLINEGKADVNKPGKYGKTPLQYAVVNCSSKICQILIHDDHIDVNKTDENGQTALHYAIRQNVDICKLLIQTGKADVEKATQEGQTALHYAVRKGSPELCKFLIVTANANVNKADKLGLTPLHLAVVMQSPEICRLLIYEGNADVNKADEKSQTPLYFAAEINCEEVCQLLVNVENTDSNIPDKDGLTPLHAAARNKHTNICQMLLEDGKADVTLKTKNGKTALDLWPRNSMRYERRILERQLKEANIDKLMKTGSSPVKTVKLFLLGHPHRGKTTLRRSLCRGFFASVMKGLVPERSRRSTPGIKIKGERISGAGFMIWDTAGKVELHVTQAMLLGIRNGIFVVVYDSCNVNDEQIEELSHWLRFIKAGHDPTVEAKPIIVLVGTRRDQIGDIDRATKNSMKNLTYLQEMFADHIDVYEKPILVDGQRARSDEMMYLKATLNKLAEPLRAEITPRICDEILKRISSWCKAHLPVLYLTHFLEKARSEIDRKASDDLLLTALGYLHDMGEVHHAKIDNCDDIIIVNVYWLTRTIFTPIFAPHNMRLECSGLEEKQEYTSDDLHHHFEIEDIDILVQLLMYFDLVYRNDDGTFIIPVKLPHGTEEIQWHVNPDSITTCGMRIECGNQTDMFSVDTFPCLQVSSMNRFRQKHVKPKLSLSGLKVFGQVEGMIQLTKDKRAIHIAVRATKGMEEKAREQLQEMKCMVFEQISNRSRGVKVNVCFLSPNDLQNSSNLEDNVRYYTKEAVVEAERTRKNLVNPETFLEELVESVKPTSDRPALTENVPIRSSVVLSSPTSALHLPTSDNTLATVFKSDVEIKKHLGSGGFGDVFLAVHRHWGNVAIKRLYLEEDIVAEAKHMWRTVSSKFLVRIMGIMSDNESHSIVMEYYPKGNLKSFLRFMTSSDAFPRKVRMILDITSGMNYLHTLPTPILHRDLKCDNVFVGDGFTAKIGDLGLAVRSTSIKTKAIADKVGTLSHMPPEALAGTITKPTKCWDVYTFAITMCEILTNGMDPWPQIHQFANAALLCVWVTNGHRPNLDGIPVYTPTDIVDIMKKCWSGEQLERPSFQELKEQLGEIYHSRYESSIYEADRSILQEISDEHNQRHLEAAH